MESTLSKDEVSSFLLLTVSGEVDYTSFYQAVTEAEKLLGMDHRASLLFDGNKIDRFNIPNHICQQMAPNLFHRERKVAFFSAAPLAFGMARVIQTYSFNDNFAVFKTYEEAVEFLVSETDSSAMDFSPPSAILNSDP